MIGGADAYAEIGKRFAAGCIAEPTQTFLGLQGCGGVEQPSRYYRRNIRIIDLDRTVAAVLAKSERSKYGLGSIPRRQAVVISQPSRHRGRVVARTPDRAVNELSV